MAGTCIEYDCLCFQFDDQLILMDQAISTGLTKAKYNVVSCKAVMFW